MTFYTAGLTLTLGCLIYLDMPLVFHPDAGFDQPHWGLTSNGA
jgi:hypothetical protein